MYLENKKYKIKTPYGWETFSGVRKLSDKNIYNLILEDGNFLDCTDDHKVKTQLGFLELTKLQKGDYIKTKTGYKKLLSITKLAQKEDVFDVVNAGTNNCYYTNDILSHNCEFLGSSHTLICATKLKQLLTTTVSPKSKDGSLDIYELPIPGHTYCIAVDVSEGQGRDYSSFSVIDVTEIPYVQIAKYRDNEITPFVFPTVIYQTAKKYNEAFILVEINTIGLQVADILHFELAYENLIKIELKGRQGQHHTPGFKKRIAFGLKHNKQTKAIGCANLKTLIESDKLKVYDMDTTLEFTTFISENQTYKAEEGAHDDLAMTLVNFGWLTGQKFFKESINSNIRQILQQEQLKIMDSDIVPFGIVDNGINDPLKEDMIEKGENWIVDRERFYVFDDLNFDTIRNKHRL